MNIIDKNTLSRPTADQFDQELLDLYDQYAHGIIDRRGFLEKASKFAVGGLTAAGLLEILSPNYAFANQVDPKDPSIRGENITYDSPKGHGSIKGYLVKPANASGKTGRRCRRA